MSGQIGRHFIVGIPGAELTQEDRGFLKEVMPSGVCLFARNIKEAQQVRDLTDSIKEILGHRSLICVDQEGGRVDRLRRILEPMPAVEFLRSSEDARSLGRLAGRALSLLGINLDFAPVVDVRRNENTTSDNGLATRMMSDDPKEVVRRASGFLDGLRSEGVQGCIKHFPGLGASTVDSHELLPTVESSNDILESIDLLPYRELIRNEVAMVMIAHASYPNSIFNSDDSDLPSSLNAKVYSHLRTALHFDGIAITDDLEMGAIVKTKGVPLAAKLSLEAGADIALICNDQRAVLDARELCAKDIEFGGLDTFEGRFERVAGNIPDPIDFDRGEWEHLSQNIIELKSQVS